MFTIMKQFALRGTYIEIFGIDYKNIRNDWFTIVNQIWAMHETDLALMPKKNTSEWIQQ